MQCDFLVYFTFYCHLLCYTEHPFDAYHTCSGHKTDLTRCGFFFTLHNHYYTVKILVCWAVICTYILGSHMYLYAEQSHNKKCMHFYAEWTHAFVSSVVTYICTCTMCSHILLYAFQSHDLACWEITWICMLRSHIYLYAK